MLKLILMFMSLFLFIGCEREENGDGDGNVDIDLSLVTVHFAIEDRGVDEWQDFITIAVNEDNIVTDIELNSITRLANSTRRYVAQLDGFEDVFEYNFYEQARALEYTLIGLSSNELVDAIRDAYRNGIVDFSTTTFADLADHALRSSPIEAGPYIDGVYHSIEDEDEDGLQYFVNIFVINGDIVAVHYNAINHEGLFKYDQLIGAIPDHDIVAWRHQAQLLEQALIRLQDPMEFTFDEEGFTADIPGVYIEIESFVSLVIGALAAGPVATTTDE